jgi:hypothetical protein
MADKNLNPMEQQVYNVSDNDNPSNYNQMMSMMQEEYNQTPEQMEDIMGRIGYHESAGTSDPTLHQYGGGPGRGLFQFETGAGEGGETAMRRLHRYFNESKQDIPDWAQIGERFGVDASKLTPEQQKMMFMANIRYHPEASLEGVTPENLGTNLWAPYHWAGADKDKAARLGSFDESMAAYDLKNTPTAEEQAFPAY